ncbi:hypothetical protein [Marinovum sp.]|nr:hypothetical protein [Marinovum sp.]
MPRLTQLCLLLYLLPAALPAQTAPSQWTCEMGFQNTAPNVPANAVGAQF